jgi:iron complex outermembrane recepter protein
MSRTAAVSVVYSLVLASAWMQAAIADGGVAEEVVVVTAARHGEAYAQNLPITLNVFGETSLRARNVESLRDLSYAMPNVQLEDVGTARGIANFSIRGVGVNSSTASVDPAVGLFVDGLYVGINAGALSDLFDVEAIEVLRGPQGTLYGRNVTGGAVLLRTRQPVDEFEAHGRLTVETGPKLSGEAAINAPLLPGLLAVRLAIQGTRDDGWFTNRHDGAKFGADTGYAVRIGLRLTPTSSFETVLRAEYGRDDGDGPAGQNHALFSRRGGEFSLDNPGYARNRHGQAIVETNWHVPFGDGVVTNIAGWRDVTVAWAADIDSTPAFVFHTRVLNVESQRSDETRYAGSFGPLDVLAGIYYFEQDLLYIDERNFSPVFRRTGGGKGYCRDGAGFASIDWHASDALTLSAGLRYTHEAKTSHISRVRRAADNLDGATVVPGEGVVGGDLDARTLNYSDGLFFQAWDDLSPRIALQWLPDARTNLYASWSRAFRGGGINFRTSTLSIAPRRYDPENQSTFEVGWKQRFDRGYANVALFRNRISDMQRDTNLADPISGVQQIVLNAGDATLYGGEIEMHWAVSERFSVAVEAGYVHGRYRRVTADLNGDLIVDRADERLRIPRLAPLNYGITFAYAAPLVGGEARALVGFHHRDAAYYNDSNLGRLAAADMLDVNLTFAPSEFWSVALYGKNLTDAATWGGDTVLPATAAFGYSGGALPTFSPLNKGRVFGIEIRAGG